MLIQLTTEFVKWYDKVKDNKAKARIAVRLQRIYTQNHFGDTKPVGDGVFELRIDYGPGYRIYYAHNNDEIILLLIGGDKSTQRSDIEKAKSILKDYL